MTDSKDTSPKSAWRGLSSMIIAKRDGLSAQGAEAEGDLAEAGEKGERDGKMNHHPAHRDHHVSAQLEIGRASCRERVLTDV